MNFKTKYYQLNMKACFNHPSSKDATGQSRLNYPLSSGIEKKAQAALERLQQEYNDKSLPFANICHQDQDIKDLEAWAEHFRQFDQVLVLGTGGSSLGGQALQDMKSRISSDKSKRKEVKLTILTNIDPASFDRLINNMNWPKVGVIVISKSGETTETLMQFLVIMELMQKSIEQEQLRKQVLMISEKGENSLRLMAQKNQFPILDHPSDLGGRYSVLSLVGLLPAMIAGLDPIALRKGAISVLEDLQNATHFSDNAPAFAAASLSVLTEDLGISSHVMLSYSDRLGSLARWHRQLWAESLGKNGHGTTPIYGTGPVDQHSQLQLWLEGPADKLYTILGAPLEESPYRITSSQLENLPKLAYFKNRSMGELMEVCRRATLQTLIDHHRPLRSITIHKINETSMGALMMHFMLETVLSAYVIEVNPFDQPAVEHGKKLIRKYLANWN